MFQFSPCSSERSFAIQWIINESFAKPAEEKLLAQDSGMGYDGEGVLRIFMGDIQLWFSYPGGTRRGTSVSRHHGNGLA